MHAIVKELAQAAAPIGLPHPLGNTDLPSLIGRVIRAVLGLAGSIALVMFVWGGFLWMTAQGNQEKVKKAKGTIIWAVLGLVAIIGSYILVQTIFNALAPLS